MSRLLGLLAGWKGYAILGALCACLGAAGSWRVMLWREQAIAGQRVRHAVQAVERRGKITFDVEMNFEMARLKDSATMTKRQEEVHTHVTPEIDRDYPVPCGFVRVFNAGTHGPIPDPAGCPDDAPSGIALSTVGETETRNDGQYDQVADQLRALQEWVRQQQAVQ
jgi:hypothetical protein